MKNNTFDKALKNIIVVDALTAKIMQLNSQLEELQAENEKQAKEIWILKADVETYKTQLEMIDRQKVKAEEQPQQKEAPKYQHIAGFYDYEAERFVDIEAYIKNCKVIVCIESGNSSAFQDEVLRFMNEDYIFAFTNDEDKIGNGFADKIRNGQNVIIGCHDENPEEICDYANENDYRLLIAKPK